MLSPFKDTLKTFSELLTKGGLLYFNAYDLGWMIYNIIDQHNPSSDFSPRDWAIECLDNTIKYLTSGVFKQKSPRDGMYIPKDMIVRYLEDLNFEILSACGNGKTNIVPGYKTEPFVPEEKYGLVACYEVLCRKR